MSIFNDVANGDMDKTEVGANEEGVVVDGKNIARGTMDPGY